MIKNKAINDKIYNSLAYWLQDSRNCLNYMNGTEFENEMSFRSNNFNLKHLSIDQFYRITLYTDGNLNITAFSKKATNNLKKELFNQIRDIRNNHTLSYFKEHFTNEDTVQNRALLIDLQSKWGASVLGKINPIHGTSDIPNEDLTEFYEHMDGINTWKDSAIKNTDIDYELIFIPATHKSIFEKNDYFYEIKNNRFLNKNLDIENLLYGSNDKEKTLFFNDFVKNSHAEEYDQNISYFNPLTLLDSKYSSDFNKIIRALDNKNLKESEFSSFMFELLNSINLNYFSSIISQQAYVFNRIYMHHSTNRKMTLQDIVKHMKNKIQKSGESQLYFLDTLCRQDTLESLEHIFSEYQINTITEESIKTILPLFQKISQSKDDFENLAEVTYLLARLNKKTPLAEFSKSALLDIKNLFKKHNLLFDKDTKEFFSDYLEDLYQVQSKAKGGRKFLNDFYVSDLNRFIKKEKVFTVKLLDKFDFLKVLKLKGLVDKDTKSNILKKR